MTDKALVGVERAKALHDLNVYGRVEVTLATHTAGGVTEKDIGLARKMDQYAAG